MNMVAVAAKTPKMTNNMQGIPMFLGKAVSRFFDQ